MNVGARTRNRSSQSGVVHIGAGAPKQVPVEDEDAQAVHTDPEVDLPPRVTTPYGRMTDRAGAKRLLLIGPEGLGLQSLRAAIDHDPALVRVGRLDDPESEHAGPDPHLVVVDTSPLRSDVAVASVAKAVLRWPKAGVLATA